VDLADVAAILVIEMLAVETAPTSAKSATADFNI
jgi:hypothetical protein